MTNFTHEMQDTVLAVRMLTEQAARGGARTGAAGAPALPYWSENSATRARALLRQFNRGDPVNWDSADGTPQPGQRHTDVPAKPEAPSRPRTPGTNAGG